MQAVFVSVDGDVEVRPGEGRAWIPATQGSAVCAGYSVRINEFGRAALQLPDKTVFRLDRNTTLTFRAPQEGTGSLLDLLLGIIHVISRDPRALQFTTPYANAGLEGTEFVIAVTEQRTEVTVIEGEVIVSNATGETAVPEGQRALAAAGETPRAEPIADPFAQAAWTPYYAPILYLNLPAPDAVPDRRQAEDPEFLAARAAGRLAAGAVAAAEADIRSALLRAPRHATSLALSGLLALHRGDKRAALESTTAAVQHEPDSVAAWIALSHVQQANFRYDDSLASLERATALEPGNPLAWAWLAELRLNNGDRRGALAAASRAASLDADLAHVQTVLGFAYLAHASAERAAGAFRRAAELDQGDPLPRLGLALALLRQGKLAEGREQAETAVILDPMNSQVRSYIAKIYAEENRPELTESQLRIARTLDPSDATPHYYEALYRQMGNRSIEALQSFNSATKLNGNRTAFRSSLRLDEDLAVRSYGLGELHKDLGFGNLALLEGWKATLDSPDDHSGHRLLADLYSTLPRHEIARVNELHKAQLLQPLNITPIPAQLAEANLFILRNVGPSDLAFTEYGPLVQRNGLSLLGSAVTAGNETRGTSVSVAGLDDRISYGAGHFSFVTDGFRENNDLDQQVTNAFVHFRPGYDTSIQTELRSTNAERGDLRRLFDATAYNPALRQDEQVDSLRLGMTHAVSPRSTIVSTLIAEEQRSESTLPGLSLSTRRSGTTIDLQHLYQRDRWRLSSGVRHLAQDADTLTSLDIALPFPPFEILSTEATAARVQHTSAYAYADLSPNDRLTATIGLTADTVESAVTDAEQISPKLGILFEPNTNTTIRVAAFRTLEGPLVSKHNIQPRLEPTHVVGFNQFYFGSEGEETTRLALGIDRTVSSRLFIGAEISSRQVRSELKVLQQDSLMVEIADRDEWLRKGYLYWTPTDRLSVATEYQYEGLDGDGKGYVLIDGIENMRTHRLPVSVNFFNERNLHARIKATYVDQEGDFSPIATFPEPTIEPGSDSFWVLDLALSYRLPKRHGSVSFSIDNAIDQEFRFQDTDPENQSIMPERMLALRFTLSY
jgi:tetratricopeptide (TPR) repeat protein